MTVTQVTHRTTRRRSERFTLPDDSRWLLELPEAQPVIARIGAAVDPDMPDRLEHVMRVAAICVRAKRNPANAYARATLPC